MQLTKNFKLSEFIDSAVASREKIDNTPPDSAIQNLILLCGNTLQPIRNLWGKPIHINSGYRSAALNRAVGGVETSQHRTGQAADITVGSAIENRKLFNLIVQSGIPFDQLIDEQNYKWLHVSYCSTKNRRQILVGN